jgi:F0F1-type ATP synthase epsilon subunit
MVTKLVLGVVEVVDENGAKQTFLANAGLVKITGDDVEVSCIDIIKMGQKGFTQDYLQQLKSKENSIKSIIAAATKNEQFFASTNQQAAYLFAEERLAKFELFKELSS